MRRFLVIAFGLLSLTPVARGQFASYGGLPGPHASFCLARIDERGRVHVRHIVGSLAPAQEIVVKKRNDKGQVEDVKVVAQMQHIHEQITTIHVSAVQLYDLEGNLQDAKKLPALLKQERPVLVVQGEPEFKYLRGFKKDLPVLALPKLPTPQAGPPLAPQAPKKEPGN